MVKVFSRSLVFLLLACTFILPSASAQHLYVSFDYSTFRYDSLRTYAELYYGFDRNSANLVKQDSLFAGALMFHVKIEPADSDSITYDRTWNVPIAVTDTSSIIRNRNLVGQIGMALRPGRYRLFVDVVDQVDTANVDSLRERFEVPKYLFDKLEVSDLELCSQITPSEADAQSIFYKNTYSVVPNPSGIYGIGMPIVYYYAEVYNINNNPGDSTFTVSYQIRDGFGQVYKTFERTRKKFGSSSVEVGTVNASDLKTGTYTFIFTVSDSVANAYATTSKRFFVYNPNLGAPATPAANLAGASVLSSVYGAMGEQQLDEEFKEARYISTPSEREKYESLSALSAKREFLYEFWQKRDTNPVSKSNDYRTEYLKRVAYANDHFRTGYRKGWQTDRGRVYILYGNPDQIDRHPNETSSRPYEIWYYNSVEGGVSFDFVDRTGFGDYTLVNSTARNEIHDDNWQQYLNVSN